jgi:hypothetical protein
LLCEIKDPKLDSVLDAFNPMKPIKDY